MRSFAGWLFVFASILAAAAAAETKPENGAAEKDCFSPRYVLVEEHHHVVSHIVDFAREGYLRSHSENDSSNGKNGKKSNATPDVNPNGAILIHIDSHADMGLTPGLNDLPASILRNQLPQKDTEEDWALVEHSVINDFLLLLGYMGIVEHVVFVEPPWSFLLKDAHFTTVDISIGVVAGDGGAAHASIRNSESTTFPGKVLTEDAVSALAGMMSDDDEPVEIVEHEELLRICGGGRTTNQIGNDEDGDEDDGAAGCEIRTVRFTTLPYVGASEEIGALLEKEENKDRDIVLDVDLDGFATTSPGALSLLQTAIPSYEVLTRIFHTVHEDMICDMGVEYWERLKKIHSGNERSNSSSSISSSISSTFTNNGDYDDDDPCETNNLSYVHGPSFKPPRGGGSGDNDDDDHGDDGVGSMAYRIVSNRARAIVKKLYFSYKIDRDAREALGSVVEYYLPSIDATIYDDDDKFVELMDGFLSQPFFVPDETTIEPVLEFHHEVLFRTIFGGGSDDRAAPKVVNVVRSPFYTPDHHLDFIECEVLDRLLDVFGRGSQTLYHSDEVEVNRTGCFLYENEIFPLERRVNTGPHPHVSGSDWTSTNTAYAWFFEDDDDVLGAHYKHLPILVDFWNEHEDPLELTIGDRERPFVVLPGESLTKETHHLERWKISRVRRGGDDQAARPSSSLPKPHPILQIDGKHGERQSHGSISGRRPVRHSTPVALEVTNPSGSGVDAELRSTIDDHDTDGSGSSSGSESRSALLAPGDVRTLRTVHGRRWSIHGVSEKGEEGKGNTGFLGEIVADATIGRRHSVLLFGEGNDASAKGSEL